MSRCQDIGGKNRPIAGRSFPWHRCGPLFASDFTLPLPRQLPTLKHRLTGLLYGTLVHSAAKRWFCCPAARTTTSLNELVFDCRRPLSDVDD